MAIVVKHGGNVAPTLAAAYGGGQGRRWAEDGRQALSNIHQKEMAAQARRAAAAQAAAARRHQSREADKARSFAEEQNRQNLDWRQQQSDLGYQRQLEERDWRQQQSVAEHELRRQDLDYELSAKQRAEFNNLSESYEQAANSGLYTDEELEDVRRQIIAKQAGIQPIPRMREKSPWPEGQGVGQTWTSDDGKFLLSRDQHGNIKKIAETNSQPTYQDRISAWKQAIELSMEPARTARGEAPNMEKAREFYAEIMGGNEEAPDAPGEPGEEEAGGDAGTQVWGGLEALSTMKPEKQQEYIKAVAAMRGVKPEIIVEMLKRKGINIAVGQ